MKLDTLVILAAAAAGLYFMSRTLKSSSGGYVYGGQAGPAASLNNYGNLPMINGGGFSNVPSYLVVDPSPSMPMVNGGGFSNLPAYLLR